MTEQTILQKTIEWLDEKIVAFDKVITEEAKKNVTSSPNHLRRQCYADAKLFIAGLMGKKEG